MAIPLPEGTKIQVIHKVMPGDYSMPSLEAAPDHYSVSFLVRGDRTVITPLMTYTIHAGSVGLIAPYVYHQTVPASQDEYESILIKFTPDFAEPLVINFGARFLEQLYSWPERRFSEECTSRIYAMFQEIVEEYAKESDFKEMVLQCLVFRLLIYISEHGFASEKEQAHPTKVSKAILEAVLYMEKNYQKQMNIDEVAEVSGYAVAYFSRLFQEQLGRSFTDYLINIRLRHVASLLLNTDKSITDIALESGFRYPGNMTSVFTKKIGMTPREYRKRKVIK